MKKRILAALLAMAILISLAGCASQVADANSAATEQTVSTTADAETTADTESAVDTEQTEKKETDEQSEKPAGSVESKEPSESTAESKPEETKPADTAESETKPSETVPKETEAKAEETKPAETTPPQTEATEPPKTEETTTETEPTETTDPVVTTPPRPSASEIEQLVAVYLNDHRAAVGAGSATVLPGLTEVARFRAEQLITNFSHHSDPDACTVLQYGEFIDMTELGLDASHNYYQGYDAEACAKGNWTGSAEDIARRIADGFRNSSGHWRYLGSSEYTYMAVGLTYDTHTAKWYCCVCVSSKNYGG